VAELLKDSSLRTMRTVGSKEIVKQFLDSGAEQKEIEISATGRDADTVYVSLGLFLQRHPTLNLTVHKRQGCKVFLVKHAPEPVKEQTDDGAGLESNLDA